MAPFLSHCMVAKKIQEVGDRIDNLFFKFTLNYFF